MILVLKCLLVANGGVPAARDQQWDFNGWRQNPPGDWISRIPKPKYESKAFPCPRRFLGLLAFPSLPFLDLCFPVVNSSHTMLKVHDPHVLFVVVFSFSWIFCFFRLICERELSPDFILPVDCDERDRQNLAGPSGFRARLRGVLDEDSFSYRLHYLWATLAETCGLFLGRNRWRTFPPLRGTDLI